MIKKNYNYSRILSYAFIIGLLATLFIVYKGINNVIASKFIICFVVFIGFYSVFLAIKLIVNLSKLDRQDLKQVIMSFVKYFFSIGVICYIASMVLRQGNVNLTKIISIALGTSIGITTVEVITLRMKYDK